MIGSTTTRDRSFAFLGATSIGCLPLSPEDMSFFSSSSVQSGQDVPPKLGEGCAQEKSAEEDWPKSSFGDVSDCHDVLGWDASCG